MCSVPVCAGFIVPGNIYDTVLIRYDSIMFEVMRVPTLNTPNSYISPEAMVPCPAEGLHMERVQQWLLALCSKCQRSSLQA